MFRSNRKPISRSQRRKKVIKSYQTFSDADLNSNVTSTSIESTKSEPTVRRYRNEGTESTSDGISSLENSYQEDISSGHRKRKYSKGNGSNQTISSGLTLDLNLPVGADARSTHNLSAVYESSQAEKSSPIGSSSIIGEATDDSGSSSGSIGQSRLALPHTSAAKHRKDSSSPTFSSHEEDRLLSRATTSTFPALTLTLPRHGYTTSHTGRAQANRNYVTKSCLCQTLLKSILCLIVVSSVVLSSLWHTKFLNSQVARSITDIHVISQYSTVDINFTLPYNATDVTVSLESLSNYTHYSNLKEVVLSVNLTSKLDCESDSNITGYQLNNKPHLVLLSCTLEPRKTLSGVRNETVTVTSYMNSSVGVLVDISISEPTTVYCVSVMVLLLVIQVALFSEYLPPIVLLLITAGISTTTHYLFQTAELRAVGEFPHVSTIIPGSLLDQLLQVASMMVLVNSLIHSGLYCSMTHLISKVCRDNWKLCTLSVILLALLLSSLIGRTNTVQLVVPLAVCVSEAHHLVGRSLVTCVIIATNVGNLLTVIGNDVISPLHNTDFIAMSLSEVDISVKLFGVGMLCSVVASVCMWFSLIRKQQLRQTHPAPRVNNKHKAVIIGNWVKAITPLTAASSTCVQFIDKKYNALLNKDVTTPSSNKNEYDSVETVSEDINESFDIYSEYRIASYSQLLICSTLTLITVIATPLSWWIDWECLNVLTFTPGIVSLTAAVCVVIATGGEERIIKSTNWLTLFYIALYRYTTEMLLTGDVLDWISTAYKQILDLQTGLTSKSAIQFLFLLSVIMSSAVLSALLGVETLAPKMMNIFKKLEKHYSSFYGTSRICQVTGFLLGANLTIYAAISNVIAVRAAAEHGVILKSSKFLLGLLVTLATITGGIALLTITELSSD